MPESALTTVIDDRIWTLDRPVWCWLVVPNCFHHLGTPAAAARFPEAKVV